MRASATALETYSAVRPAHAIVFFIVLLAGAAAWALIDSALATFWTIPCVIVLLIYTLVSVRRWLYPDIVRIGWDQDRLVALDRQGRSSHYRIDGSPFVSPFYLGLSLVGESGRRFRLGLFNAQVDSDFWREAMVRLKQQALN